MQRVRGARAGTAATTGSGLRGSTTTRSPTGMHHAFKTPTLPYFHDGSAANRYDVISVPEGLPALKLPGSK